MHAMTSRDGCGGIVAGGDSFACMSSIFFSLSVSYANSGASSNVDQHSVSEEANQQAQSYFPDYCRPSREHYVFKARVWKTLLCRPSSIAPFFPLRTAGTTRGRVPHHREHRTQSGEADRPVLNNPNLVVQEASYPLHLPVPQRACDGLDKTWIFFLGCRDTKTFPDGVAAPGCHKNQQWKTSKRAERRNCKTEQNQQHSLIQSKKKKKARQHLLWQVCPNYNRTLSHHGDSKSFVTFKAKVSCQQHFRLFCFKLLNARRTLRFWETTLSDITYFSQCLKSRGSAVSEFEVLALRYQRRCKRLRGALRNILLVAQSQRTNRGAYNCSLALLVSQLTDHFRALRQCYNIVKSRYPASFRACKQALKVIIQAYIYVLENDWFHHNTQLRGLCNDAF